MEKKKPKPRFIYFFPFTFFFAPTHVLPVEPGSMAAL